MNTRFPGFMELLRGDLRIFLRDHMAILLAVVLPIVSIPLMLGGMEGATEAGEAQMDERVLEIHGPEEIANLWSGDETLERTATRARTARKRSNQSHSLDLPEGPLRSQRPGHGGCACQASTAQTRLQPTK